MVPTSFQNLRALRLLNIAAVGLALAAVVVSLFPVAFHGKHDPFHGTGYGSVVGGVPTLLCGMLWAWLLRRPATVGKTSIRWGWVASIPLAMLNSGLTLGLLLSIASSLEPYQIFVAFVLGATFGAIAWIPALLGTLACFGLPIARAQRLAKKGLAGEERGERIVGFTCFVMSAVGLLISLYAGPHPGLGGGADAWFPRIFALLGLLAGAISTALARAREARRRAFVVNAEAGKIPGYRIESTDEGKVLVRIVAQGNGYRVADFEEEVFELDAAGEAVRPKHAEDVAAG